jgi:ABC-type nitrate/sulfonate/bicarbonate transport system ATPase subunit
MAYRAAQMALAMKEPYGDVNGANRDSTGRREVNDGRKLPEDRHDAVAVSVRDVSLIFPSADGTEVTALQNMSLDVPEGQFVALLGPSGCGKSTLLNIVAGLIRPTTGEIRIDDTPLQGLNQAAGYLFQEDTLLPWASALTNVVLPMEIAGKVDYSKARILLELVGLKGFEDRRPLELSGGMRKRVQFARLLAQDPRLILMDEPFGALDALTKLVIQREFLRIWEPNPKTVLFVTHDPSEAILLGDRILVFSARPGRVVNDYAVPIGRPRTDLSSLMKDDGYRDLHSQIVGQLLAKAE